MDANSGYRRSSTPRTYLDAIIRLVLRYRTSLSENTPGMIDVMVVRSVLLAD